MERKRKDILMKLEKMSFDLTKFNHYSAWTLFQFAQNIVCVRHTQSWDEVHKFCDARLKVWSVKPSQVLLPTLLPWIEETLDNMSYMRTETEEGTVLWRNLPTAGVVSSLKKEYFMQLITGLLASKPVNSVCIILHANRAGEGKKKSDPYKTESC